MYEKLYLPKSAELETHLLVTCGSVILVRPAQWLGVSLDQTDRYQSHQIYKVFVFQSVQWPGQIIGSMTCRWGRPFQFCALNTVPRSGTLRFAGLQLIVDCFCPHLVTVLLLLITGDVWGTSSCFWSLAVVCSLSALHTSISRQRSVIRTLYIKTNHVSSHHHPGPAACFQKCCGQAPRKQGIVPGRHSDPVRYSDKARSVGGMKHLLQFICESWTNYSQEPCCRQETARSRVNFDI